RAWGPAAGGTDSARPSRTAPPAASPRAALSPAPSRAERAPFRADRVLSAGAPARARSASARARSAPARAAGARSPAAAARSRVRGRPAPSPATARPPPRLQESISRPADLQRIASRDANRIHGLVMEPSRDFGPGSNDALGGLRDFSLRSRHKVHGHWPLVARH